MMTSTHPSPVGGRWREATDEGLTLSSSAVNRTHFPHGQALIRPLGTFSQREKGVKGLYFPALSRLFRHTRCHA